ncbi:hypothetical protein D3C79_613670 [compost metagenome]
MGQNYLKGFIEVETASGLTRSLRASEIAEVSELPSHTKSNTAIVMKYGTTVYCVESYHTVARKIEQAIRSERTDDLV